MSPPDIGPCPDFLVIGHVTKDLQDDGYVIGGTATYSAVTARNLGWRAGMITRAEPDLEELSSLKDIEILHLPSLTTTAFQNIYTPQGRRQFLRAVAPGIQTADVPPSWRGPRIVHLGPVAQELPADLIGLFDSSLVGLSPQGWLRQWDEEGRVGFRPWPEAEEVLARVDVLIFSPEDVAGDAASIRAYVQAAPLAVLTIEREGAIVYRRDEGRHFPARPAQVLDPTGAGDVFAAAYLIRLSETGDVYEAARFANCVASFSIEGVGIGGIPPRPQVEAWLELAEVQG